MWFLLGALLISALGHKCDQMTKLCFQYLAIFSNQNVPICIQIVQKRVENFDQIQINLKYIAKNF